MDPALPPGGLQQVMSQYDAIRSHSTKDDGPPPWDPEPDTEAPKEGGAKNAPPPGVANSQHPVVAFDATTQAAKAPPTEVTGFITPVSQDDGSGSTQPGLRQVTVDAPAPPQQVLTDATRARPKGRPKAWAEDAETKKRAAVGERNMQFALDHPNRGTFAGDETGL